LKLITKHTDYAIRALVHLAGRGGQTVAVSEIAQSENIPEKFLKRLMLTLKNNKYILTKEGKGGGVTLAKSPEKIFILDIMRLFQGEFQISDCMFKKDKCPNRRSCMLRGKVKAIEFNVVKQFREITISSLLNGKSIRGG
jgi:Rrf2 family transcriptional regulator, cysteine metabolism repressor